MQLNDIEKQLIETLKDYKLDSAEKAGIKLTLDELDVEQTRFLRNKAFSLARAQIESDRDTTFGTLKWLEQLIKTLDNHQPQQRERASSNAHFSPGDACRRQIIELCEQAKNTISICVFTISDNRLTEAILNARSKGVNVRIITDNDKSNDRGSDVDYLLEQGVNLYMDDSPYHMHHKFMLLDEQILMNGSFNWTRSASEKNQENILVTEDQHLVTLFQQKFDALWKQFAK